MQYASFCFSWETICQFATPTLNNTPNIDHLYIMTSGPFNRMYPFSHEWISLLNSAKFFLWILGQSFDSKSTATVRTITVAPIIHVLCRMGITLFLRVIISPTTRYIAMWCVAWMEDSIRSCKKLENATISNADNAKKSSSEKLTILIFICQCSVALQLLSTLCIFYVIRVNPLCNCSWSDGFMFGNPTWIARKILSKFASNCLSRLTNFSLFVT